MGLAGAASERERRDLVTREVMEESRLIRFVAGPDGQVARQTSNITENAS